MMQDAACIRHARGRNDDGRALLAVECAGFRRRPADTHLREVRHMTALFKELDGLIVEVAHMVHEDARRVDGQRAVENDRHILVNAPLFPQTVEVI